MARRKGEEADRRSLILEQAIGVIGERGYYGFKIQDLARRCGLSNPGLLHYFPSKPDVLLAVLQEMEVRETPIFEALLKAVEQARSDDETKTATVELLRTMVARAVTHPAGCRLLAELQSESLDPVHPAHGWWCKREADLLRLFVGLLGRFVEEPQPVARQLLAVMDGLGVQWLRAGQGFDLVAEWRRALARLLPELNVGQAPTVENKR